MVLSWINSFKGELAGLSAAFFWALSSIVFVFLGQRLSPLRLNLLKGLTAIPFIGLTLLLTGQPLAEISLTSLLVLCISGILGIGLGDTVFFAALNQLGARRTLLIGTLAPPLAAILALWILGETLKDWAWCGILLTGLGVGWVISERTPSTVVSGSHPFRGILWAILAAVTQAVGVVLSRYVLTTSDITPLWTTLIRLIVGTSVVYLLLLIQPKEDSKQFTWSFKLMGIIALTTFFSTYLGIWLQQTSLKFSPAGISQTLTATSPLFVIPLAAMMGERITLRAILGVLMAIGGIAILFR